MTISNCDRFELNHYEHACVKVTITILTSLSLFVLLTRNSSALGGGATVMADVLCSSVGW